MRIALAQIDTKVGDLAGNSAKVLRSLEEAAKKGAVLAVFPEQTLGGYPALDLWEEPAFAAANERALKALAKKVGDVAALVGFLSRSEKEVGKPVRNSAALLHKGKVVAVRHKTLLPTYDVFDEARYFEPATENAPIDWGGRRLGVTICEDAWAHDKDAPRRLYGVDPVAAQAKEGADLLINLSASPFVHLKGAKRRLLISEHAKRLKLPFFYCNLVGGNDEVVFDGSSFVMDAKGDVMGTAAFAAPDMLVVDDRGPFDTRLSRRPQITEEIAEVLTLGIGDFADKCGLKTAFIGLSGGIDSAVTAALAVRALGPKRVVGVSMPSEYSSKGSVADAEELADNLGIELRSVPIAGIYDAMTQALGGDWGQGMPDLAEQNLQARARGTVLMGLANKAERGFVLTTGNKSELGVGYCTLYGDMCGALAPLGDATKEQVYDLAKWLNKERVVIPKSSITKAPSAELRPGQKDQDDLPSYDLVDQVVAVWTEMRLDPSRIANFKERRAVEGIIDRMDWSEFKRRQAPPVLKITPKAFGLGRRMPIAKAPWRVRVGL